MNRTMRVEVLGLGGACEPGACWLLLVALGALACSERAPERRSTNADEVAPLDGAGPSQAGSSAPPQEPVCSGDASCTGDRDLACGAGSFEAGGACIAWTSCEPGQYVAAEGSARADRECADCESQTFSTERNAGACTPASTCREGHYAFAPASLTADRECRACAGSGFDGVLPQGACVAWAMRFGTSSRSIPLAIEVDAAGDVIAGGSTHGDPFATGGWGERTGFVIKLAGGDGRLLWARQFGPATNDQIKSLAIDAAGDVTIVGFTEREPLDGDPGFGLNSEVAKLAGDDGATLWSRRLRDARAVAVDGAGDIVVAAWNVLKLHGDDGTVVWTQAPAARLVDVDSRGDVLVVGDDPRAVSFSAVEQVRKLAAKDGRVHWQAALHDHGVDRINALRIDSAGDVVVGAESRRDLEGQANLGGLDAAVVKLAGADGAPIWMRRTGSSDYDFVDALSLDAGGEVWVAGWTLGSLSGADPSAGGAGAYAVKLAGADGEVLWANAFGNSRLAASKAIAASTDDLIVVAGLLPIDPTGQMSLSDHEAYILKLATGAGDSGGRGHPSRGRAAAGTPPVTSAPACPAGNFADESSTTAGGAAECRIVRECPGSTIEGAEPTPTDDRYCAPCPPGRRGPECAPCPAGVHCAEGEMVRCDVLGGYDRDKNASTPCEPWSECGAGESQGRAPSSTEDRQCRLCDSEMCAQQRDGSVYAAWARQVGTTGYDSVEALAVDGQGRVAVASSIGNPATGVNPALHGAYVEMLASEDGAMRWRRQIAADTWAYARAVAFDRDDGVVAISTVNGRAPTTSAIARLSADSGRVLWQRRFGTREDDVANAVAVDPQGNIVVVGATRDAFGDASESLSTPSTLVVKLAPGDGRMLWRHVDEELREALALAIDARGDLVVTAGSSSWPSHVIKLAGRDGAPIWQHDLGDARAHSASIDAEGDVIVTGVTHPDDVSAPSAAQDVFAAKLAGADGRERWRVAVGGLGYDSAHGMAAIQGGDVVLVGCRGAEFRGTEHASDAWLVRLAGSDGRLVFSQQFGGTGQDCARAVAIASDGRIVVAGETDGDLAGESSGLLDAFVMALQPL